MYSSGSHVNLSGSMQKIGYCCRIAALRWQRSLSPGPTRRASVKLAREGRFDYLFVEATGISAPPPPAQPRRAGRRALTSPLVPPRQKNRSPPSDSSPDTVTPGGISSLSSTSPVRGSTRRKSLSSPSQVPHHSSRSIQVTP